MTYRVRKEFFFFCQDYTTRAIIIIMTSSALYENKKRKKTETNRLFETDKTNRMPYKVRPKIDCRKPLGTCPSHY